MRKYGKFAPAVQLTRVLARITNNTVRNFLLADCIDALDVRSPICTLSAKETIELTARKWSAPLQKDAVSKLKLPKGSKITARFGDHHVDIELSEHPRKAGEDGSVYTITAKQWKEAAMWFTLVPKTKTNEAIAAITTIANKQTKGRG